VRVATMMAFAAVPLVGMLAVRAVPRTTLHESVPDDADVLDQHLAPDVPATPTPEPAREPKA